MKLNRLETHDRLRHFKKDQEVNIFKGADDCLKKNPLSLALQDKSHYIYLFAHPRTAEDGVTKKMFWQPRLSRPKPQTNSYLFRAQSKTDIIEICWLLPPREMWPQYEKGKVTENEYVLWSIDQFENNRAKLAESLPDDLSDEIGGRIYHTVISEFRQQKMMDKLYIKPKILEASQDFY